MTITVNPNFLTWRRENTGVSSSVPTITMTAVAGARIIVDNVVVNGDAVATCEYYEGADVTASNLKMVWAVSAGTYLITPNIIAGTETGVTLRLNGLAASVSTGIAASGRIAR